MAPDSNPIIRAKNVMRKGGILSIDGMATARQAAAKMRVEKISWLLVDKRNTDDAWGILVIQDFIKGVIIPGRSPADPRLMFMFMKS